MTKKSNVHNAFNTKSALRHAIHGGKVRGPGGPTDDMIPAMLSNGEYVLPADTVQAVGKENLERLRQMTHTPVHMAGGGFADYYSGSGAFGTTKAPAPAAPAPAAPAAPVAAPAQPLQVPTGTLAAAKPTTDAFGNDLTKTGFSSIAPRADFGQTAPSTGGYSHDNNPLRAIVANPQRPLGAPGFADGGPPESEGFIPDYLGSQRYRQESGAASLAAGAIPEKVGPPSGRAAQKLLDQINQVYELAPPKGIPLGGEDFVAARQPTYKLPPLAKAGKSIYSAGKAAITSTPLRKIAMGGANIAKGLFGKAGLAGAAITAIPEVATTPAENYAARFSGLPGIGGTHAGDSFGGDLALRSLGAASDIADNISFGQLGKHFYPDRKAVIAAYGHKDGGVIHAADGLGMPSVDDPEVKKYLPAQTAAPANSSSLPQAMSATVNAMQNAQPPQLDPAQVYPVAGGAAMRLPGSHGESVFTDRFSAPTARPAMEFDEHGSPLRTIDSVQQAGVDQRAAGRVGFNGRFDPTGGQTAAARGFDNHNLFSDDLVLARQRGADREAAAAARKAEIDYGVNSMHHNSRRLVDRLQDIERGRQGRNDGFMEQAKLAHGEDVTRRGQDVQFANQQLASDSTDRSSKLQYKLGALQARNTVEDNLRKYGLSVDEFRQKMRDSGNKALDDMAMELSPDTKDKDGNVVSGGAKRVQLKTMVNDALGELGVEPHEVTPDIHGRLMNDALEVINKKDDGETPIEKAKRFIDGVKKNASYYSIRKNKPMVRHRGAVMDDRIYSQSGLQYDPDELDYEDSIKNYPDAE